MPHFVDFVFIVNCAYTWPLYNNTVTENIHNKKENNIMVFKYKNKQGGDAL